jgi:hypothetical protein
MVRGLLLLPPARPTLCLVCPLTRKLRWLCLSRCVYRYLRVWQFQFPFGAFMERQHHTFEHAYSCYSLVMYGGRQQRPELDYGGKGAQSPLSHKRAQHMAADRTTRSLSTTSPCPLTGPGKGHHD